jgi:hypothetical protein
MQRVRRQKRWLWFGAIADDVAIGAAIVRTGYAANVFCWAFDRNQPQFREDVSRVLPRPTVAVARTAASDQVGRYRGLFEDLRVMRDEDVWTIDGHVGDVRLQVRIEERAVPVTAVCPVEGVDRGVNVTRKQACAVMSGTVRAGSLRTELDDAPAFIDHSHGMLAGETIWQWAIGHVRTDEGRPIGLNLVASFNDAMENVLWIDGVPHLAGPVQFEFDPDAFDAPWRVTGDDLDLTLEVEGIRTQTLDLGVVASEYVQPIGRWTGTIHGSDVSGVGVAEHHRSVW